MLKKIMLIMLLSGIYWLSALTLEQAKQLALDKNPKYQGQKDAYASAKWAKRQALAKLYPSVLLSASYVSLDPPVRIPAGTYTYSLNPDTRTIGISLSQPLFMGGKLWQSYKINSSSAEISRLSLESSRLSVISEVETKYLSVLQLQELLLISEKDLESTNNSLVIAKVRYDSGTLSSPDYLKIQSKKASKEVALIQSQTALELAKQDLANTLSVTDLAELEPVSKTTDEDIINKILTWDKKNTDDFLIKANALAEQNNPGLKTTGQLVQISRKAYNIARGNFLPTVMLSLSRSSNDGGIERYEYEATNTLALSASVPIFPLVDNYSASRKAWYDLQKSYQDRETANLGINLGVKAAALNMISSARQIKAANLALNVTQQTYDQLMERFRNNLLSTTDMLDAEVMLQAAEVSQTNAFFSYLKAKSALIQAIGTDDIYEVKSLWE